MTVEISLRGSFFQKLMRQTPPLVRQTTNSKIKGYVEKTFVFNSFGMGGISRSLSCFVFALRQNCICNEMCIANMLSVRVTSHVSTNLQRKFDET